MKKLTTALCLTIALLFGCAGVCKSADHQKGEAAFNSGDYAMLMNNLWRQSYE